MSEKRPLVGGEKGTSYAYAPPPHSGEAPPPHQVPYPATATTTVITQTPVIVQQQIVFGEIPVQVTCPNGGHQVTTIVTYKNGTLTFMLAALLCFFLGPCCAIIPFFIDSVKDVEHTCPVDGTVLGIYKRA